MVVDDIVVKYSRKENALHLKLVLEDKCKFTTYWQGKLYIWVALKWEYEKGTVQISVLIYVGAAHSFQHEKKRPQFSPYPWNQHIYGKNNHILNEKKQYEELDKNNKNDSRRLFVIHLLC